MEDQGQEKYVDLNVGGTHFKTSLTTLLKGETMLSAMFSGRMPLQKDENGMIFIDRDGRQFYRVLNFLRDGEISLPETQSELDELIREAQFYCIEDLIKICESENTSIKMKEKMEKTQLDYLKKLCDKLDWMSTQLSELNYKNGAYRHRPNSIMDEQNINLLETARNIQHRNDYERDIMDITIPPEHCAYAPRRMLPRRRLNADINALRLAMGEMQNH